MGHYNGLLRGKISRVGWWVLASAMGWAIGHIVGAVVLVGVIGETLVAGTGVVIVMGAIFGTVVGAVVGISQWLVLQGKISRAGWWIPASIVGWGMDFAINTTAVEFAVSVVVERVVGGIVAGGITGGVLVWLLRHHNPDVARANEVE